MKRPGAAATLTLALVMLTALVGAQGPRGPARDITNVTGDLYRARNGAWATVFYVTPDGIILGDPINTAFATWLKEQLAQRFKVPVRYVVYSHSHFDHSEGGAVFADTARFVAHENMLRNMDGRYPQMPGDMLDRNNNGRFELDEIVGPLTNNQGRCGMPANFFRTSDRNSDGFMTPAELQQDIRPPDILYSERMWLTLGGKKVQLVHPGKNHSDDATVLYFPVERVAFAAGAGDQVGGDEIARVRRPFDARVPMSGAAASRPAAVHSDACGEPPAGVLILPIELPGGTRRRRECRRAVRLDRTARGRLSGNE